MGVVSEFSDFLKEYKIVALAVAFMMGAAVNELVKSFVNNIVMPLLTPFIPNGAWDTSKLVIGSVVIGWGAFLGSLIHFIILALVVFFLVKKLLKHK